MNSDFKKPHAFVGFCPPNDTVYYINIGYGEPTAHVLMEKKLNKNGAWRDENKTKARDKCADGAMIYYVYNMTCI